LQERRTLRPPTDERANDRYFDDLKPLVLFRREVGFKQWAGSTFEREASSKVASGIDLDKVGINRGGFDCR
jgi:hypothetical protein